MLNPPSELKHYGIPGMRWGVQNGPPYPLSRQPRFGGNGHNKSGTRSGLFNKVEGSQEKCIPKKLKRPETDTLAISRANPHYRDNGTSYKTNCYNCVIAAALRMQGYDVTAKPAPNDRIYKLKDNSIAVYPKLIKNYSKCIKDYVFNRKNGVKDAEAAVRSILNGDLNGHGAIQVMWDDKYFSGHIFNWVANNGSITFHDPQTGYLDVGRLFFSHTRSNTFLSSYYLYRFDKADWNWENLNKAVEYK